MGQVSRIHCEGIEMKKLFSGTFAAGLIGSRGHLPGDFIGRRLLCTILLLSACIWGQGCVTYRTGYVPPPSSGDVKEVKQLMHRYLAAFNVDDFETIGACWHTPGWLSTSESLNDLNDREEVKALYRSLLGKIRAQGYDHSELLTEGFKFVNAGCAIYRITFTRWKKDGDFMPPRVRGSVCTLFKVDGKWRLCSVALEPGTGG